MAMSKVSAGARTKAPKANDKARRAVATKVDEAATTDAGYFEELNLRVSSPAILLNHIAERYPSTSRILMEFVDNAFDSAEALFDRKSNSYTRPISIEVLVDMSTYTLKVTDNCEGMPRETLARVTTNVGESQKRGQSFLNGQFGFGMQAFRACCRSLRVRSRASAGDPLLEINIDRHVSDGISMQDVSRENSADIPASGTEVSLQNFDDQWANRDSFSPGTIAAEIEAHFERLLSRGNLAVSVRSISANPAEEGELLLCRPLDYAAKGAQVVVNEVVELGGGQRAEILLGVAANRLVAAWQRPARFFAKGRRIGNMANINSFARGSARRWDVWAHPQLVGYIDVLGEDEGPLRPMITRDEFKNTKGRVVAYRKLAKVCEERLFEALTLANNQHSMKSLQSLEDVLSIELQRVERAEKRAERLKQKESFPDAPEELPKEPEQPPEDEPAKDEEKEKEEPEEKKEKGPDPDGFTVKLVDGNPDDDPDETPWRSSLVGNTIMVNTRHPDFNERFRKTRSGAPKIDERLCSYLANIVSAHYRDTVATGSDAGPTDRLEEFESMIDTYCRYENRLRKAIPSLTRTIQEGESLEER